VPTEESGNEGYVKVVGKRLGAATFWEFAEHWVHPENGIWVKCAFCDWHKVYAAGTSAQHKDIKTHLPVMAYRNDVLLTPAPGQRHPGSCCGSACQEDHRACWCCISLHRAVQR
jgi:hypothetical protein